MSGYQKPSYTKEAIIQAELYAACKKMGLICNLQCSLVVDRKGWDLPDLVVIEHNQIICIVEVKDYNSFGRLSSASKNQIKRYKKHNIPVFIIYSIYDIPYLVKKLVEVRKKFLESVDSDKAKCFEADRQNEEKWDKKIATAFSKFDELFPDYRFTNNYSLETLVEGVEVLGLPDLLKLMDEYFESSASDFLFALTSLVIYRRGGRERFLNTRKGTILTLSSYENRQDRINEKLS